MRFNKTITTLTGAAAALTFVPAVTIAASDLQDFIPLPNVIRHRELKSGTKKTKGSKKGDKSERSSSKSSKGKKNTGKSKGSGKGKSKFAWYLGSFYEPCTDVCLDQANVDTCNAERQNSVDTIERAQFLVDHVFGDLQPSLASTQDTNIGVSGYLTDEGVIINPFVTVDSISPPFLYTFVFGNATSGSSSDCDAIPFVTARICCCAKDDPLLECPVE